MIDHMPFLLVPCLPVLSLSRFQAGLHPAKHRRRHANATPGRVPASFAGEQGRLVKLSGELFKRCGELLELCGELLELCGELLKLCGELLEPC